VSTLKLFNTLSGQKEEFVPLKGREVRLYACGPTPYDVSHLGHARMNITFDVVQRYLRFLGYDVTYVRNITDIEDKIINRAAERGLRPEQLAREYTYQFWRDMHDLNVQSPDFEPRCSEFIPQMIDFIEGLIKKGHAYAVGSDVYFNVPSWEKYGQLKKQNLDEMMVGARDDQVRSQDELKERKRHPADFALWKGAAANEPGWDSPWGKGRPGWHLECSVMNEHVLGDTIDIHGGGMDLVFPHHENEIAQSESLHDKPLAKYWMHNNFVQINAEKMAKSLGNFRTIKDLLAEYSPDAVRLFLLQTHYRSPIEFTADNMNAARSAISRLIRAARLETDGNHKDIAESAPTDGDLKPYFDDFVASMNDDFHTPQAISVLFALSDKAFGVSAEEAPKYAALLRFLARLLGLTLDDTTRFIDTGTGQGVLDLVLQLRQGAREKKDFQTSDQIRDGLQKLGIKIMDVKTGGSTWERL
jgi:cysteinyl-tRNA synthetase